MITLIIFLDLQENKLFWGKKVILIMMIDL